jgi:hypothetical protein
MRYWWVNQNQTYRHEIQGGYLWSPKRNANGARNPFYESMREVQPGDLIFSFVDTRIFAVGIARDSNNEERLNGENGLLLTPSVDHLFDRGFIGFENNGTLIISPVAHRPSLERLGIQTRTTVNVGSFTNGQKQFLDFHRNSVLLQSIRARSERSTV